MLKRGSVTVVHAVAATAVNGCHSSGRLETEQYSHVANSADITSTTAIDTVRRWVQGIFQDLEHGGVNQPLGVHSILLSSSLPPPFSSPFSFLLKPGGSVERKLVSWQYVSSRRVIYLRYLNKRLQIIIKNKLKSRLLHTQISCMFTSISAKPYSFVPRREGAANYSMYSNTPNNLYVTPCWQ